MAIKNIVFDVGNVLIRWDPSFIIQRSFPSAVDQAGLMRAIFKHPTWYELNLGFITEQEALEDYYYRLGIDFPHLYAMMEILKDSLIPLENSINLLYALREAQFKLYALTDNTREIIAFLQQKYDFWPLFQGMVVSAQVGYLKPSKEIYQYLLDTYQLRAEETLFIDDYEPNVLGAKVLGMEALQFQNSAQCKEALQRLHLL